MMISIVLGLWGNQHIMVGACGPVELFTWCWSTNRKKRLGFYIISECDFLMSKESPLCLLKVLSPYCLRTFEIQTITRAQWNKEPGLRIKAPVCMRAVFMVDTYHTGGMSWLQRHTKWCQGLSQVTRTACGKLWSSYWVPLHWVLTWPLHPVVMSNMEDITLHNWMGTDPSL